MRELFIGQLEALKRDLLDMNTYLISMMEKCIQALNEQNNEIATEVIEQDHIIDVYEKQIEDRCMKLVLHQQPVANDLINITTALKMIRDFERIGDNIASICETMISMSSIDSKYLEDMKAMANEELWMLKQIKTSLENPDKELVQKIISNDDLIDERYKHLKQTIVHFVAGNEEMVADLILMGRYFERIGDHMENIGKWLMERIA